MPSSEHVDSNKFPSYQPIPESCNVELSVYHGNMTDKSGTAGETGALLRSSSDSSPSHYPTTHTELLEADTETQRETGSTVQNDRSVDHDILPETATYGRTLSWPSTYILVISRVIGSGVFATPGSIVKSVGSVGLTLSLWVVGTILSGCALAVWLELGCMLPRSGGDKVYLEFIYRHPRFLASTLIAVQAVLLGFSASNCIIFSKYTLFAFNEVPSESQSKTLAVGLLTLVTLMHGRFLKAGIWVQNVLGWIKIFLVIAMSCTGIWVILFRRNYAETETSLANGTAAHGNGFASWNDFWRDSNWSWGLLCTSLFKVFYSYAGLNNVNNVMNEVRNPVKTLKTVGPAALLTACALYLLANISYFLVVPIDEIKNSGELVAALFFERVFGERIGRTLFPLAIAISAAGNVMVVTFASVRESKSTFDVSFSSNQPPTGKSKLGNRPPRLPPLFPNPIILTTLQLPSRRTTSPLHPLPSCNHPPPARRRVQLHPRRRSIPRAAIRTGSLGGPVTPPCPTTRPTATIQGVAPGRVATDSRVAGASGGPVFPSAGSKGGCGVFLRYVCYCGDWDVS